MAIGDQVAIVILNYNGKNFLQRFLPDVILHSAGVSIYVVDNNSGDGSADLVETQFPSVNNIGLDSNNGYAGGYNVALKAISAEIYVLLNTDVQVTPNWLDPVVDLMTGDPEIAACQPKLLSFKKQDQFEYAGAAGGFIDYLGFPFCRGRIFQTMETDTGQYDDNRSIFWASGACLFVRSDVFHQVGGFDEDFFAHMEEVDLCWRIWANGHKVFYCAQSTVYHVGGGTLSKANPRKTYLNFRNGLTMIMKNERGASLFWKLPLRAFFDFVAAVKFTFGDSLNDGLAVWKAHLHFWLRLNRNIKKRKGVQQFNQGSLPPEIVYSNSIVLDYFLRRKRQFRQLHFP